MKTAESRIFVYRPCSVALDEFVSYWSMLYDYPTDEPYTLHLQTPYRRESIHALFTWKAGRQFLKQVLIDVDRNFVSRVSEAQQLVNRNASAAEFLESFPTGGAIYRIFWMHCWEPNRFPIYDQHVHRAMAFIQEGRPEELALISDKRKVRLYLERYLPFVARFSELNPRDVDRALWAFGKFVKRSKKKQHLPLPA